MANEIKQFDFTDGIPELGVKMRTQIEYPLDQESKGAIQNYLLSDPIEVKDLRGDTIEVITTGTVRFLNEGASLSANFRTFSNDSNSSTLAQLKARGTIANPVIVNEGDGVFLFSGQGYDGTRFLTAAQIAMWVDGTPGMNDMPGRLVLRTTPAASGGNVVDAMAVRSNGNVIIRTGNQIENTIPLGKLHVEQQSTTGAIPVLVLDQKDVSEEMMQLETTIGTGNAIEAVGAKTLTTTHFVKVTIPGGLTRYFPVGTIA